MRSMRASAPRRSHSSRNVASPKCSRILASFFSSTAASALAMPLTNGSTPMKPVPGWCPACAIMCSPPPTPISRRVLSTGTGKSSARSGGAGLARSMASCGNSVSINAAWCGRNACPLRRPKKAPRGAFLGSETDMAALSTAIVNISRRRVDRSPLADRASDVLHQIRLLPGEAAVLVRCAAEMTIGGGAPIDRPVQLERAANVGRCEAEDVGQDLLELFLVDLAGSVGIDQDRHRVGNADGIGDLDGAALGDAGRDHVLGEIARRIGRGAVDLGRVLAGERAAAVRSVAAVGIDDDLAAGQPAVA